MASFYGTLEQQKVELQLQVSMFLPFWKRWKWYFIFQFAMDAINAYLISEVEAAYKKVEQYKKECFDLRDQLLVQDGQIIEIQTELEQMEDANETLVDQHYNMEMYAKWLEDRCKFGSGRTIPKRLLRYSFESGRETFRIRSRFEPGVIYQTDDMINWQEIYDLTR